VNISFPRRNLLHGVSYKIMFTNNFLRITVTLMMLIAGKFCFTYRWIINVYLLDQMLENVKYSHNTFLPSLSLSSLLFVFMKCSSHSLPRKPPVASCLFTSCPVPSYTHGWHATFKTKRNELYNSKNVHHATQVY
jgi:hypothetical protein